MPHTAAILLPQAKRAAEADNHDDDDGPPSALSDLRRTYQSTVSSVMDGLQQSRSTLAQTVDYFSTQFRVYKEQVSSFQRATKKASSLEQRDLFPRMPWHDVQAAISGSAARDLAAHFVQRWNHHRLSTSTYSEPVMYDVNDNLANGECARCEAKNIRETATHCPACSYALGPINSYSEPADPRLCPEDPEAFSYVTFECKFYSALPFRMQGDCPVVVTALLQSARIEDNSVDGALVDLNGPMAEWLHAFGLVPAVGDVLLAVDGQLVTQLNSNQFKRLVKRKRAAVKAAQDPAAHISVTFRRHYLEVSECFVWLFVFFDRFGLTRMTRDLAAEPAPGGQEVRDGAAGHELREQPAGRAAAGGGARRLRAGGGRRRRCSGRGGEPAAHSLRQPHSGGP